MILLRRMRRHERGEAAVLEAMFIVGFLLLPAVLGLSQIPRWIDARSTAELAAQEAARQMVLAESAEVGRAAGEAMAQQIVINHGWPPETLESIGWGGDLMPGGEVTAIVTVEFPTLVTPMGSFGGGSLTRSHSERVDDYREFP